MVSNLCRRMHYLRLVEGAFALGIPSALVCHWLLAGSPVDWTVRLLPLMLVSYILIQGAFFWHLKYLQYKTRAGLPSYFSTVYKLFRRSNTVAFCAITSLLLLGPGRGTSTTDLAWAGSLSMFAILEHINYYCYQLMYDTAGAYRRLRHTKKLRTPVLALDLRRPGTFPCA